MSTLSPIASKLKPRQLALVVELIEYRNVRRAANALNMTQSTASKLLKDLEEILGASLFIRLPREMKPTDLGLEVHHFALRFISQINQFAEDFRLKAEHGHGLLILGAIMGVAPDFVARVIADMKSERPYLTIRLLGETSDQILDRLEAGEIEVAVGRFGTKRHWHLFEFEPLGDELLELVVRPGNPLLDQPPRDLIDLIDHPWVLQPPTTPTRQLMDNALIRAGLGTPNNYIESASVFAILQLVQSSNAVTILPVSVVRDHLDAGILKSLPNPIGQAIGGFGIIRKRNEPLSEPAEDFCARLRAMFVNKVEA